MTRPAILAILLASTLAAYIGAATYPEPTLTEWVDYAPTTGP